MSTALLEAEPTTVAEDDGPDIDHIVCHCTDDKIAACGQDVSHLPWVSAIGTNQHMICSLCVLVWPTEAPACPWGCTCFECGSGITT